jgi:hypothetical protein
LAFKSSRRSGIMDIVRKPGIVKRISYLDSHDYRRNPEVVEHLSRYYGGEGQLAYFYYLNGDINEQTLRKMVRQDDLFSGIGFLYDTDAVMWLPAPGQLEGNNWFKKLGNEGYAGRRILLLVDIRNEYAALADESSDAVFDYVKGGVHENVSKELESVFSK